jgi:hypothetical protein
VVGPQLSHYGSPKKAHDVEYTIVVKDGNGKMDGLSYLRAGSGVR